MCGYFSLHCSEQEIQSWSMSIGLDVGLKDSDIYACNVADFCSWIWLVQFLLSVFCFDFSWRPFPSRIPPQDVPLQPDLISGKKKNISDIHEGAFWIGVSRQFKDFSYLVRKDP